jgi:uncharacterized membrane protein
MNKERLSAFTDGVVAVIITIMVLELKPPHGADLEALRHEAPTFLSYVLSFVYVAIYWNNHHHFFTLVKRVNGAILWANLHLLFWISLVPFTTAWMGENPTASIPVAVYGFALFMPGAAWLVLQRTIIRDQGPASPLKAALGRDLKGKLSPFLYAAGIGSAFINPWLADTFYVAVALMWLVPDRRVEEQVIGATA